MVLKKIGFIGFGNMASAIIKGIIESDMIKAKEISVYDKNIDRQRESYDKGLSVCKSLVEVLKKNSIIMLAVKPQDYPQALRELQDIISPDKIIVSFAPGVSSRYMLNNINQECGIIRVMPNMPIYLGYGATAICNCNGVSNEEFEFIKSIFKSSGITEEISEDKFDYIVSVNASSPAYVYMMAKAMCEYALSLGIDYNKACSLVFNTIRGSAEMLINSGYSVDNLINMVCSPGGTTIKAVEKLEEKYLGDTIKSAMNACTERALEISI